MEDDSRLAQRPTMTPAETASEETFNRLYGAMPSLEAFVAMQAQMATFIAGWPTLATESEITTLQGQINALAAAIAAIPAPVDWSGAISGLQGQINALNSALSTEITNRTNADTALAAQIAAIPYQKTVAATVVGGNAVFQFTTNGLASGTSMFPGGLIDANNVQFRAEEGQTPTTGSAHFYGVAVWSNGGKTLTVPVAKTGTGISVALVGLTLLGQNVAANGSVVYATTSGKA